MSLLVYCRLPDFGQGALTSKIEVCQRWISSPYWVPRALTDVKLLSKIPQTEWQLQTHVGDSILTFVDLYLPQSSNFHAKLTSEFQ